MNPFNSLSEVFYVFFLAGAGWGAASLSKELVISIINNVAGAIIQRRQMAAYSNLQAQAQRHANLAKSVPQFTPEEY